MKIALFGATGRTGQHLLAQALEAGHSVAALTRDPSRLSTQHERLVVVQGDVRDAKAVDQAIAGADGVLCALGHTRTSSKNVLTVGTQNIIRAMQNHDVRRQVCLTGAGVRAPGDPASSGRAIMLALMALVARPLLEDAQEQFDLIQRSDRDWVVVRAPRMTDGPYTGTYRTGFSVPGPGHTISRADAADFMLKQLANPTSLRQAPFIYY